MSISPKRCILGSDGRGLWSQSRQCLAEPRVRRGEGESHQVRGRATRCGAGQSHPVRSRATRGGAEPPVRGGAEPPGAGQSPWLKSLALYLSRLLVPRTLAL